MGKSKRATGELVKCMCLRFSKTLNSGSMFRFVCAPVRLFKKSVHLDGLLVVAVVRLLY